MSTELTDTEKRKMIALAGLLEEIRATRMMRLILFRIYCVAGYSHAVATAKGWAP